MKQSDKAVLGTEKECLFCQKKIIVKAPNQKFCSHNCSSKAYYWSEKGKITRKKWSEKPIVKRRKFVYYLSTRDAGVRRKHQRNYVIRYKKRFGHPYRMGAKYHKAKKALQRILWQTNSSLKTIEGDIEAIKLEMQRLKNDNNKQKNRNKNKN